MWVEISYLIGEKETVLIESLSKPRVIPRTRFSDGKSNQTSILEMSSHNGTHIDAPWHVIPDGKKITDFEASDFVFDEPYLIECPKGNLEKVNQEDLEPHADSLKNCNILLVYTGFSKYRRTDPRRYIHQSPGFSAEGAHYIVDNFDNIRCIGIDFLGIENIEEGRKIGWPAHKILLGGNQNFFLIEDMNLAPLVGKKIKRVYVAPLRFVELEASPVTVFAEV